MTARSAARSRALAATPALAAAIVVGLTILLGAMSSALFERLAEVRTEPRDNVQWVLMQLQNESARMHQAVTEAMLTGDDGGTAQVVKRFDILFSRFDMVEQAPVLESLRKHPDFRTQLAQAKVHLERMIPLVDVPSGTLVSNLPALKTQIAGFQSEVQVMVLGAIQRFAAESDAERAGLSSFIQQMGVIAALLIMVLILAVILLQIQSRKLRRREAALLESRNLMAATARVSLDAIIMTDKEGKIIEFNAAAEDCLGRKRVDALGQDMATLLIPERYREAHRKGMERFLATGNTVVIGKRIELDSLHADGHEFPVELAIGVTETEMGPVFISHMRNISQRKSDEAAMRKALADAQEGLRTKERFLATISHEIRTPLNGVIGVMELLKDTRLTTTQAHYVQIAQQSGEALLSLISDILDISKMNASGVELHPEPADLRAIVFEAVETTAAGAAANGNRVSVEISEGVPAAVVVDAGRLRQVMLNLLSNAQKFTKGGRITVRLAAIESTGELEFSVTDTGVGFDPALAGRLFHDFTTLDPSYQRETGGTGLGLAISQRIIEAMGGKIGAIGQPGGGSQFWFRVRLPGTNASAVHKQPETRHSGLLILVAEDNDTNLMVTRQMLQAAGHRVDEARNGAEAVERAGNSRYDVILMDVSMPGMDGMEAARAIRANSCPSQHSPIIALTANAMQEGAEQAMSAGMNGYLSKPIRRIDLIAAIDRIVEENYRAMNEPVLDEAHFAQLCSDITPQSAREVLKTFLSELADRHADLRAAHTGCDAAAFGKICHAISGAASMVGASGLSALTHEADVLVKSGRGDAALGTYGDIEDAIGKTLDALSLRAAA